MAGLLGGPATSPASEVDLRQLFARGTRIDSALTAEALVSAAFENLLPSDFMMQVESVRTDPTGGTARASFRLFRKELDERTHIVTESLAPSRVAGTRMLQIEAASGLTQTYTFVRTVDREPFETSFRLVDPFLCVWHEAPDDEAAPATGAQNRPAFEVLSRRPDSIDGERVQRIMIRPRLDQGYDRMEVAIAEADYAILEYLRFVDSSSTEPSLVARVDRADLRRIEGHLLPTVLRYEDRPARQSILVKVEHIPMPGGLPDALFSPRSFHRSRVDVPEVDR